MSERVRAERHADADLAPALRDEIRDHAVDAERGEQQRDAAEHADEQEHESLARHRSRDDVFHRGEAHRHVGAHLGETPGAPRPSPGALPLVAMTTFSSELLPGRCR